MQLHKMLSVLQTYFNKNNYSASTVFSYTAENLWNAVHHGRRGDREQKLLNHALQNLGVRWNGTLNDTAPCDMQTAWRSYEPVASIVFPQNVFCRRCCTAEHSSEYYLVHLNCPHQDLSRKAEQLKAMNSWFLLDDWKDSVNSMLEGDSWLMSIYTT